MRPDLPWMLSTQLLLEVYLFQSIAIRKFNEFENPIQLSIVPTNHYAMITNFDILNAFDSSLFFRNLTEAKLGLLSCTKDGNENCFLS